MNSAPLLGDHIFEVILYKGPVGLGMNLAGGANEGILDASLIYMYTYLIIC